MTEKQRARVRGGVIQALRTGGRTNAVDRRLVKSIVEPVAKDHATQVNLINNGTLILKVDSALAEQLAPLLSPKPSPSREEAFVRDDRVPSRLRANQVRQLEEQGLPGTALNFEGQWYARLLGGGRVLVPIHDFGGTALEHNQAYTFKGRAERGRFGEIVRISISGANALGSR